MARCPRCKETVSQFAAGCAYCGYDLEQGRRDAAARRARRPALPGLRRRPSVPAVPDWAVTLGLLALATVFVPVLGLVLTGLAIRRESLTTQGPLRIALWVLLAAGLVLLFSPETRYGLVAKIYGG